jgi:hypothetical protein
MMQTYTLSRDGQRPVRFVGELVAEEYGAVAHGRDQNRYFNLALYQLENRRYLVHWDYQSRWRGEHTHSSVASYATMDEAVAALETFDPLPWIEGFKQILARSPESADDDSANGYKKRQEDLERTLLQRYRWQVAQMCEMLDYAEEL